MNPFTSRRDALSRSENCIPSTGRRAPVYGFANVPAAAATREGRPRLRPPRAGGVHPPATPPLHFPGVAAAFFRVMDGSEVPRPLSGRRALPRAHPKSAFAEVSRARQRHLDTAPPTEPSITLPVATPKPQGCIDAHARTPAGTSARYVARPTGQPRAARPTGQPRAARTQKGRPATVVTERPSLATWQVRPHLAGLLGPAPAGPRNLDADTLEDDGLRARDLVERGHDALVAEAVVPVPAERLLEGAEEARAVDDGAAALEPARDADSMRLALPCGGCLRCYSTSILWTQPNRSSISPDWMPVRVSRSFFMVGPTFSMPLLKT